MPQSESAVQCEILTSVGELEAVAGDWHSLWEQDPGATPFQSPAWLLPWWRFVGQGELLAVAVRRGARLAGFLPVYVYTEPGRSGSPGQGGRRKLLLVGAGTTDYLGGVFDPGEGSAAVEAALACLLRQQQHWDAADLHQLPPDSPLLLTARRWGWPVLETEPCLRAALPANKPLSAKLADNIRYYRRRAERTGALAFQTATEQTALGIFESLVALHTQRWKERGEAGVLDSADIQQSHRAAIPELIRRNTGRLCSLSLDGKTIAAAYCLLDPPGRTDRACYYYLNGFDPDFAALSPGTLLLGFIAEGVAAEGAVYLDMLRGQEHYKRLWKAAPRPTYGFSLPAAPLSEAEPRWHQ